MRNFFKNPYGELAESSRNYTLPRENLFWKAGMFLLSILLLIFSLFPAWFFWNPPAQTSFSNRDIIAIVDVSESMSAVDGKKWALQTRLDTVKKFLSLVAEKDPNNRFALIAFEAEAQTLFPLSDDVSSFMSSVWGLKARMLTQHGSSISAGLTEAKKTLTLSENPIILIFSDSGEESLTVPKGLSAFSPIIYGVGSENGAKIPKWNDIFGTIIYRKYQGEDVIVRLDTAGLKKLSNILSWEYIALQDAEDAYRESFSGLGDIPIKAAFPLYLLSALCMIASIMIPLKRKL